MIHTIAPSLFEKSLPSVNPTVEDPNDTLLARSMEKNRKFLDRKEFRKWTRHHYEYLLKLYQGLQGDCDEFDIGCPFSTFSDFARYIYDNTLKEYHRGYGKYFRPLTRNL